ncbi:hypothetical protein ILUMI_02064 [Ignelater luminosus]|uniref:Odorant receptor n=1 Tax=Ignelater luminosus TaxID=2038154 RepID=A0A8K0GLN7_IGNLU|nr:hypothetical protein ILUMI_02064 [Ignelater luminosus]
MVISNSADAFRVQYKMLVLTGLWPKENPNIVYRLRTLISWISAFGLFGVLLIQLINDIKDFTKLSETLYIMVSYVGFIIKLLTFTYQRKEFLKMIHYLKDPIFVTYPEDLDHYMTKYIKQSVLLASTFQLVIVGGLIFFALFPILDNKPLPMPLPYDLGKYTTLMYCLQVIGESISAINHICLDVMCTSLMGLAATYLNILSERIMHLKEKDAVVEDVVIFNEISESTNEQMRNCVKHHLAIINMVDSIEDVFTIALFGQFLTSVMVLCNTIFNIIVITVSTQTIMLSDYMVAIVIQLFMYCWYGNEIIAKSLQIRDACYMAKWYAFDKKTCKYLFIIMERSKRPLRITTMKIYALSLTAFATVSTFSLTCY